MCCIVFYALKLLFGKKEWRVTTHSQFLELNLCIPSHPYMDPSGAEVHAKTTGERKWTKIVELFGEANQGRKERVKEFEGSLPSLFISILEPSIFRTLGKKT